MRARSSRSIAVNDVEVMFSRGAGQIEADEPTGAGLPGAWGSGSSVRA
jgi:hypothetical protein